MSPLCFSVWGRACRGDSALPGLWSVSQEEAVSSLALHFLLICHWCPSSCCPGAESQRGWVYMSSKSVVGPLRGQSFFCCPNLHWLLEPEDMGTYLHGAGALGWVVWDGSGIPYSWGISPILPTTYACETTYSHLDTSSWLYSSLPLLPIWLKVASLNPWLLDFHTAWFSENSGWYLFCSVAVFFTIVVCVGEACLPPPSWPKV